MRNFKKNHLIEKVGVSCGDDAVDQQGKQKVSEISGG